jgi:hypothetical protein
VGKVKSIQIKALWTVLVKQLPAKCELY